MQEGDEIGAQNQPPFLAQFERAQRTTIEVWLQTVLGVADLVGGLFRAIGNTIVLVGAVFKVAIVV